MITRLSIAFEDFPGSSIASQVMPPWCVDIILYGNVLYVQLGLRQTLKQFTHMSVVWYLVDSPRTMIDPSARVVGYCADRIITNYHGGRSSRAIIGRGLSAHHYKPALH